MLDLEQARKEIAQASEGTPERLSLLLEHSKNFYRNNPKESEKWAHEALALAKKLKNKEAEARAHYNEGCAAYQLSDYDRATKLFTKAIALDRPDTFHNPLLERPYLSLGLALAKQGKYKEAFEHYERALVMSRAGGRKSEVDILGAMGNAALEQGDYPKALEYQYQSLAAVEAMDDPLRRSVVLSNIGRIYAEVQDLKRADLFLERSSILKKEIQDSSGLSSILSNRGIIAQNQLNFSLSRKYYNEALSFAEIAQRKDVMAYVEERYGVIELEDRNVKEGLKRFQRAVELSSNLDLRTIWCASLIGEGRAFIALDIPDMAIKSLKESFRMCEESGLMALECECVSALASAYQAAGRLKESVKYFNKFIALNGEVHSQQKQRILVEISARIEIEKADRERERMEQLANDANERAELLRSETERQSKQLTELALQLVQKNEFLCDLKTEIEPAIKASRKAKSILERIDDHIRSDRDWETFEHQFDQVHRDFLNKLSASYPALTPTELKIAAMIKLNLPTKSIANLFCLSVRTVENHRQSIRRKLKLSGDNNLVSFLIGFGE
jgi:tetratricopeptide (TPR) repeat protein